MSFTIFQNKKNAFQGYKNNKFKKSKINIFPNWLTHGFGPKKAIFPAFVFSEIRPGKGFLRYFRRKKTPFYAVKTSSKSPKIDIFLKGLTHGFGPKMTVFRPFFQAIKARGMSFTIFQNKKKAFLLYKNKQLKNSKI